MSSIALIPARGGSKGIPRKNIKLFNSKPLIFWTIKAAIESEFVDRVIVSTDDEEIAHISKSFSAEVPFLRPKELAQDNSPGIDLVIHAINNLKDINDVLLLQPTSPLRRTKDIDEIFKLRAKKSTTSAVSISDSGKHIDLFFRMDSHNKIKPISSKFKSMPRQKYNKLYNVNGALYLSTKDSILQNLSFFTSNTIGYVMPAEYSIDIDTQLDWDLAEFLMQKLL